MPRAFSAVLTWVVIPVALAVLASGCGGAGGAGGGGGAAGEIATLLGFKSKEGSKSAPLNLGTTETDGVVQHDGSVANGGSHGVGDGADSYYLVQGIQPGVEYTVTMAGLTDDADIYLYQGDPTFGSSPFTRINTGTTTESFTVQANQSVSTFFVGVDGSKTSKGASYDLSVIVKPLSEGSTGNPANLFAPPVLRPGSTVGSGTTCCGIQATGDSYYVVDTSGSLSSDTLISVSAMTDDVDLYVYDDAGFSNLVCESIKVGTATETCLVPSAGNYYIAVDGYYAAEGAAYSINVIDAPIGTIFCDIGAGDDGFDDVCNIGDAPQLIGNNNGHDHNTVKPGGAPGILPLDPFATPVGTAVDSYYFVTGVTPGNHYRVAIQDLTDKADLYVFDRDPSYTTSICKPPYPDKKVQECIFTATSNAIYFAVDGFNTVAGAAYSISVLPEFLQEGTPDVPLDLGAAPVVPSLSAIHTVLKDDDIGISGDMDSYYQVTVVPGTQYIVGIPALTDDVDLYVFDNDATFTNPVCVPFQGGATPEQCIITATGNTIYFAVDGYFTFKGAAYVIQVQTLGAQGEGSLISAGDDPKDLGNAPVSYDGFAVGTGTGSETLDLHNSFYQIGVSSGRTYKFSLAGVTDDVDLFVYTDPSDVGSFSPIGAFCDSFNFGVADETCLLTVTGNTVYIWVDSSFATLDSVVNFTVEAEEQSLPTPTLVTINNPVSAVPISWAPDFGIGGPQDKYYKVAVTIGQTYRVQITGLTDDLDLYLFGDDSSFLTPLFTCPNTYFGGPVDEFCDYTVPPTSSGFLYFAVDSYWMSGFDTTFDLEVVSPAPP